MNMLSVAEARARARSRLSSSMAAWAAGAVDVVRLEIALAGIVHEYVLLSLSAAQLCFALLRNSPTSLCAACWTHPGFEAYEELISVEFFLMIWAHEQAVAGLVGGVVFRLLGDPVSALELRPLVTLRQL